MTESAFTEFLQQGITRGGFQTDDILAAVLPLMREVIAIHDTGRVATLRGLSFLVLYDERALRLSLLDGIVPSHHETKLRELLAPASWLAGTDDSSNGDAKRAAALRTMETELAALEKYAAQMLAVPGNAGIPLRQMIHRLIEIRGTHDAIVCPKLSAEEEAMALKNFLHYAESLSQGESAVARQVLDGLNPLKRKSLATQTAGSLLAEQIATALENRGWSAETSTGQSRFRCDVAVRLPGSDRHQLALLLEGAGVTNVLERFHTRPSILRAFGWQVVVVMVKDWWRNLPEVLVHRS